MKLYLEKAFCIILTLMIPGSGHLYINKIKSFFIFYLFWIFFNPIVFWLFLDFMNPLLLWIIYISNLMVYVFAVLSIVKTDYSKIKVTDKIVVKIFVFLITVSLTLFINANSTISFGDMSTNAMSPTIQKGDYLIVKESTDMTRKKIVMYNDEILNKFFVSRIIATERDEIYIEGNSIYVHYYEGDQFMKQFNKRDDLKYIHDKYWIEYRDVVSFDNVISNKIVTVKSRTCYVLNDNNQNSTLKHVSVKNIVGEPIIVYFSYHNYERVGLRIE